MSIDIEKFAKFAQALADGAAIWNKNTSSAPTQKLEPSLEEA